MNRWVRRAVQEGTTAVDEETYSQKEVVREKGNTKGGKNVLMHRGKMHQNELRMKSI